MQVRATLVTLQPFILIIKELTWEAIYSAGEFLSKTNNYEIFIRTHKKYTVLQ